MDKPERSPERPLEYYRRKIAEAKQRQQWKAVDNYERMIEMNKNLIGDDS